MLKYDLHEKGKSFGLAFFLGVIPCFFNSSDRPGLGLAVALRTGNLAKPYTLQPKPLFRSAV